MAKPKVDPVAWAKAAVRDRGGHRCYTCGRKDVLEVVKKWVEMWKARETDMSVRQAREFLSEHFGYKLTTGSLSYCLNAHHGFSPRG